LAILSASKFEPKKFKASRLRLPAVKRNQSCLLPRQLQPEFLQPLPQHLIEPFSILLPLEGTDKIAADRIRQASPPQCFFTTCWNHPSRQCWPESKKQSLPAAFPPLDESPLHSCPTFAPLTTSGALAAPCQQCVLQHLQQPIMIDVVKKPLDVGFHYAPIPSKLQLDDQLVVPSSRTVLPPRPSRAGWHRRPVEVGLERS